MDFTVSFPLSPRKSFVQVPNPQYLRTTVFGDEVFKEVIKLKIGH